ncbi:TIGR01244 family sulfur transferase [Sinisalibacter aestuarii]|uniref:Oxidoreductase n=1 Tax=Sinisalibacter aestuarii TaxID=2949426 RepID=A0ABQ5LY72_9RHOB|nr:TIGR01244 family sulfur transferase [Sinisalibacter aestuarii]GKY89062.1 oxidoreductase [Sinisalibacter aestuarii]
MNPDWKELDQQVTVSGQIRPEDVPHIAAAGYRVIVCNRPDGEEAGQPDWDEIATACRHNGVTPKYVPLADRSPTDYAVNSFGAVMRETEGKVFAYCRSGARCQAIWNAVKSRQAAGAL